MSSADQRTLSLNFADIFVVHETRTVGGMNAITFKTGIPFLYIFVHIRTSCKYLFQDDTASLLLAVATMQDTVAYFSSVDDPSERCMTAERPVFIPEEDRAVFVFHYQGKDDQSNGYTRAYCVNITASDSGKFPFGPCEESETPGTAQMLFFDGHSCFGGRFPLSGTEQCILWVKVDPKDSVSDECLQYYDQQCGSEKYKLYDSEQCT
ncbi:uncharacterized protein [Dermacentor andersoni]|uniref:uncharacterized protein n=1 Tax=Dermacentor andersoni TaxID=34620 RepID=UPI002415B2A6|nr:uncharacterized protein LOC126547621 [Dermacentor andersoni]